MAASIEPDEDLLYIIVGSQFAAKVIVALDALGVPYKVVECHPMKLKQSLVPPHTIPQMRWRGAMLTDSADILAAIDRDFAGAPYKLYPPSQKAAIVELESYAGSTLNAFVFYFAWWVDEGFVASYERKMLEDSIPFWSSILPLALSRRLLNMIVDTGRLRGYWRKRARTTLGEELIPQGREPAADELPRMKAALLDAFRKLDAYFQTADQRHICATEQPSAADFALYGILERLVGNEGDGNMGAVTPWAFGESGASKLQAWHARMQAAHPIRFTGKTGACKAWATA